MIDVLQRLRELDEKNPNVHTDALENTEKLNPPVEEAKKKMVKDPKTGKMVPDYAIDGKGKDDLKKENVKESITISADSPEDLPVIAQIMKLAGMQAVTPDMMPDVDNVPAMKADDNINGSPCGCDDDSDNAVITKTDKGVDFDLDRDGAPDMSYDNSPDEAYQGVDAVTTNAGTDGLNGTNHPQDIRVKDASPYANYEQRLAKLAGIETEAVVGGNARPIDPKSVFARLGNDIQSIMNDALDGNDMADDIADELGDYLRNGDAPEGSHYEKAIQIVMSSIHDGPQAQAEAAEEAISVLHSEEKNPKFADEDYENEPDEKYQDQHYMTKDLSGGSEQGQKRSYPKAAGADNPMALEDEIKAELSARLAEYMSEGKGCSCNDGGDCECKAPCDDCGCK